MSKPRIPYLKLMTKGGAIIKDFDGSIVGDFMTTFAYEYDETSEDDKATIKFSLPFNRTSIVDHRYLGVDSVIKIQWGYRNGPMSPTRTVAIRDTETVYDKRGLIHTLKCSDLISYLKATNSSGSIEAATNFYEYVLAVTKNQYKIYLEEDLVEEPATLSGFMDTFNPEDVGLYPHIIPTLPDQTQAQLNGIFYKRRFAMVFPHGKSDFHQIQDAVESAEGNQTITGRDDKLKIQKAVKGDQAISKYYALRNGLGDELLSFLPETKFKSNDLDISEEITVNEETGDIEHKTTGGKADDVMDWEIPPGEVGWNNWNDTLVYSENQFYKSLQEESDVPQAPAGANDLAPQIVQKFLETFREAMAKSDNSTGTMYPLEEYFDPGIEGVRKIPTQILLRSPDVIDSVKKTAINAIAKKEYNKRKMVLKVVGDPRRQSDTSISITGAASRHNGKYYLQKVTHKITQSGYITAMEGIKVNIGKQTIQNITKHYKDGEAYEGNEELYDILNKNYIPTGSKLVGFRQYTGADSRRLIYTYGSDSGVFNDESAPTEVKPEDQ